MEVIRARNVNDAYSQGIALLKARGVRESSRAGDVLVMPTPVTTVYERPQERVLLDPKRDANPFFHLGEALHMLAGRNDARWLDRFVKDFSSRFAEDDGRQHGAYGYRWRHHFDVEGGGRPGLPDQLDTAVQILRADPHSRRVVLTMWDPVSDLGVDKRDLPCNTHIYLRINTEDTRRYLGHGDYDGGVEPVLDLTVCCRSNDAIWGATGANAVHFSVLQEYLAGRIGVGVGRYYQISNNYHAYLDTLEKVGEPDGAQPYAEEGDQPALGTTRMGTDWERWDQDLQTFMSKMDDGVTCRRVDFYNDWFFDVAEAMRRAHDCWKAGEKTEALQYASLIKAPDWSLAVRQWFERRMQK